AAGGVVVPIYPSSSAEECEWVIANSGAVAVFCENAAQLAKVATSLSRLDAVRHIILIDPADEVDISGVETGTLEQLRSSGRDGDPMELARRTAAVEPEDVGLIVYTSGTTGRPKGCTLTHRNMTSCCRVTTELEVIGPDDVVYLFLPMAHVFAQVVQLSASSVGAVVAYCSGDATRILPDFAEVQPTFVPSVPRIFEKVYSVFAGQVPPEMLTNAVAAGTAVRQLEAAGQPVPEQLAAGFAQADAVLFAKVRGVFGGKLRGAISGAAPIAPEILQFFHAAGVPVYEGYGMSESSSVGTLNSAGATKIGTIGRPVPGCEARIAEDGEILMRGPHIFAGYWDNPEATAETLVDGWLQTGDLGAIDEDGYVTITGRKKDIIITAGGKNLTPANLENDLRQSPWISHAVMHGDRRPYPVALITLDPEYVIPWAKEQGLPTEMGELAVHPTVQATIQEAVDRTNSHHAKVSQIKKFAILDHDLSLESGDLTPTLKVKRAVVQQKYAGLLDAMYEDVSPVS
ncbi:MAG: long-chain fatty acid--CoA ligase, partial [Actinomycetota bacterium]|nr:long-chain fatty acid--CoA ligase [Actinomycetota bacterium]